MVAQYLEPGSLGIFRDAVQSTRPLVDQVPHLQATECYLLTIWLAQWKLGTNKKASESSHATEPQHPPDRTPGSVHLQHA